MGREKTVLPPEVAETMTEFTREFAMIWVSA